jgi:biopolymer transport protein ExbB
MNQHLSKPQTMTHKLIALSLCFACAFGFAAKTAQANNSEATLLKDIQRAQQQLQNSQSQILREREQIAGQLRTLETDVISLRQQTAVARRLEDEASLSLDQLQKRLGQWQQQQAYQRQLIQRFDRQFNSANPKPDASLSEQLTALNAQAAALHLRLNPQWQSADIVLASGVVATAETLTLGPVHWFWQAEQKVGGLATREGDVFKEGLMFSGGAASDLEQLHTKKQGAIRFDPSLSRAIALAQQQESLVQHIAKGGLWAVPIMLFALFALTIAIAKGLQLWRLPALRTIGHQQLSRAMASGTALFTPALAGMQKTLLDIALGEAKSQVRDDQLFTQLQTDQLHLNRWIGAIAVTASVSPLLGLLGTVSGMIETFKMMTLFGSGDPEVVSGGIAQALITTELGLVVAIPALILNAVLSRKAKNYYSGLEHFALQISQLEDVKTTTDKAITYDNSPAEGVPAWSRKP